MKISLFLGAALTLVSISIGQEFPLARTSPSKTPAFTVDPTIDFHFELGRGSGWTGLDTIAFGRNGIVTLFRQLPEADWQTASLKLDTAAIARIFKSVRTEGIMKMAAAYHANVDDGSQWILWITQGEHSKAIYFDNYFPPAIRRLAKLIDTELAAAGLSTLKWQKVPTKESRLHEQPLWNSIK